MLPDKLPEIGKWSRMARWLNQLRDEVRSLRPTVSVNTLTSHTKLGVQRESQKGGKGGTGGDLPIWL